jgi:hypothetical protein
MEVFAECGPSVTSRRAVELCDWLERRTLADGGLPLALPVDDPAGSSPIWTSADPSASTLQMTSQVAAHAHRLAMHQPEVAEHPWLAAATRYCLDEIRRMDREPQAHELMFSIAFLDSAAQRLPEADELPDNLGRHIPDDGVVRVQGGTEDETLHPTQLSPWPGLPSRRLFSEHVIDADLERLAGLQQRDGGWTVDFEPASAAAALEWRGYATVQAIAILKRNGVLVR